MALLILPIGIVLGLLVRPPHRAEVTTYVVGFGAFVVISLLWVVGIEVRPFEGVVLLIGTPVAGAVASWVGRRRSGSGVPAHRGAR